jgi:hypothetical protein
MGVMQCKYEGEMQNWRDSAMLSVEARWRGSRSKEEEASLCKPETCLGMTVICEVEMGLF